VSNLVSFGYIVPELLLGAMAVILFLLSAMRRRNLLRKTIFPGLAILGLMAALSVLVNRTSGGIFGGDPGCISGCSLFFGLLATDPLADFFRILVISATTICVLISMGSPALPKGRSGEYHGLLMVMCLGMCLLSAANHLLMVYVAMETVSLCSYLLTGWDARKCRSREAGMKYVLFGGVASGVMLFGMSLFYGLFGNLSFQGLHLALQGSGALSGAMGQWAALLSVVFMFAGFGYKIAATPFHMWCPDVYEGAPTPFTALLSVGPKAVGMALILRFFYSIFLFPGSMETVIGASGQIPWLLLIGIVSAVTMTLGNLAALLQNNVKRLLAYSSIAHAGYILMGVTAGGQEGFEAVSLYMAVYLIMNMGAFAVVSLVEKASGSEELQFFRGLGKRAPLLALIMTIFLISLAGLPPTAGFIGKLYLFAALLERGGFWFLMLALVGVTNSVVSLYFYARVLKSMYMEKPEADLPTIPIRNPAAITATALSFATLFLGLFWQPLATAARWSATLFH